jgi:hypothetical protein
MNKEIYEQMRIWENIRSMENEERARIIRGDLANPEEFSLFDETEDSRRQDMARRIATADNIAAELGAQGIDVEHIVTSFNGDLKRRIWVRNYEIIECRKSDGSRTYLSYEGGERERESYDSIEEAVQGILGFYDYLGDSNDTAEDILNNKWYLFKSRE